MRMRNMLSHVIISCATSGRPSINLLLQNKSFSANVAPIYLIGNPDVRDEHEWKVKKEGAEPTTEHCDFHPLKVCSCGNCADKENFKCNGKDYATRYVLTCPFHSLLYEIECDYRASIADSLVHPVLKRGHSN